MLPVPITNSFKYADEGENEMSRLYDINEVAVQTGLSKRAIYRGIKSGRFPATREDGKLLLDLRTVAQILAGETLYVFYGMEKPYKD